MTRIKVDILPSLGQGNSPRTFSTSPSVSDSSVAAGKASVSSVATNEATGTAINSPHPQYGDTHGRSESRHQIPLPTYFYGHLKYIQERAKEGRPSLGAGNELFAPHGGHLMATLVTQARSRSATTQHLLVEEGISCHITQWGPKRQDCTVEIIQIRHACNYRYFIQTGGAGTSLGIWGIISLDAKQETMWWMGDRLMGTLPRAAWWDRGTINVLRTCPQCGHPRQAPPLLPLPSYIMVGQIVDIHHQAS